jgi:hypothetical protein
LQDHVIGAFDLPVRPGVRYGRPIHADMVIVAESEELFTDELCVIVGDDGVWDPKEVDNIGKEEHHLLRFDSRDRPSFNPL